MHGGQSKAKKLDVVTSEGSILYHFDQFGSHMTFLYFQKILKNRTNREQITCKSEVKNNCVTRYSIVISKNHLQRIFRMMKTQTLNVVTYRSMSSYFRITNLSLDDVLHVQILLFQRITLVLRLLFLLNLINDLISQHANTATRNGLEA